MSDVRSDYLTVHRQGFVPIFVADRFDAVALAGACVEAGASAVEITCRRAGVVDEVRRVRREFPSLTILIGSVVDDGPMLDYLRRKRPDFPTLAELADLGVDGFVSAAPLSAVTLGRYRDTHLLMPGVETVREAWAALEAGAHFAKLFTTSVTGGPQRVAQVCSAPLHGLPPIFVTGGVTLERIEPFMAAGAAVLGSGWDVLLGSEYEAQQDRPESAVLADALRSFVSRAAECRASLGWPALSLGDREYLGALGHYHPLAG